MNNDRIMIIGLIRLDELLSKLDNWIKDLG